MNRKEIKVCSLTLLHLEYFFPSIIFKLISWISYSCSREQLQDFRAVCNSPISYMYFFLLALFSPGGRSYNDISEGFCIHICIVLRGYWPPVATILMEKDFSSTLCLSFPSPLSLLGEKQKGEKTKNWQRWICSMNQSLWKRFYGLVTFLARVGDLYKISHELFFPVHRKMPENLDKSI